MLCSFDLVLKIKKKKIKPGFCRRQVNLLGCLPFSPPYNDMLAYWRDYNDMLFWRQAVNEHVPGCPPHGLWSWNSPNTPTLLISLNLKHSVFNVTFCSVTQPFFFKSNSQNLIYKQTANPFYTHFNHGMFEFSINTYSGSLPIWECNLFLTLFCYIELLNCIKQLDQLDSF